MSDEYLIASFPTVRLTAHGEVRECKEDMSSPRS